MYLAWFLTIQKKNAVIPDSITAEKIPAVRVPNHGFQL
jgi:hypothetical protein